MTNHPKPLHGIAWPMASDGDTIVPYVERDDEMNVYPDDIAAARVVAKHTGTPLMFIMDHGAPEGEELNYIRPFVLPMSILAMLTIDTPFVAISPGVLEQCAKYADAENTRICEELGLGAGEIGDTERHILDNAGGIDAEAVDAANAAHSLAHKLYAAARGEIVDWSDR